MSEDIDVAIEFQLDLSRVSAGLQAKILKALRELELQLIGITGSTEWKRNRIDRQLRQVNQLIESFHGRAEKTVTDAGEKIAATTASAAIGFSAEAVAPSTQVLASVVKDVLVSGAPQKAWWAKQTEDLKFKFASTVRQGVVAAETNQQIIARVKDVMKVQRHNVAALVQTEVASIANDARQAVFDANEDIIEVYRALATLDSNTCLQCAPLDGLEWEKDGTPIGHSYPKPLYPLHYNCRCLLIPRISRNEPGGARASDAGPVSAKTTFTEWLDRQSKEKQVEILGEGRAEMYRRGKITLSDLTSGTGRPLTLKQLQAKYG